MKLRSQIMRPVGILALGLVLLGGSLFAIPQAYAQSVTATTSVSAQVEAKPVSFFEKMKLLFTFKAEKKAELLQKFSARNFELAKEKLEAGQTAKADIYFKKSEKDSERARVSASQIKDAEKKQAAESSLDASTSNRIQVLTAVQAKIENPVAKEAIQNAILRAEGDAKVDVEAKASEGKGASVSGNASANPGTVVSGGTVAKCLPTAAPSITVLSPNGGEVYTAGQQVTVKWKSCPGFTDSQVMISLKSTQSVYGAEIATVANTGSATITLPTALYSGTIPLVPGKYYKISLQLGGNAMGQVAPSDTSDNLFTINNGSFLGNSGGISSSCFASPDAGETWPFGSTNTIQLTNPPVYNSHCSNTFSLVNATTGQRVAYLGIQSQPGQSSYSWFVRDTLLSFNCGTSGDTDPAIISAGQYKIRFEEQDTVNGVGQPISCESGVITLD